MTTALDIASQTHTGVLACRHDPALTCREGEDVTPLLAAAYNEDVFCGRRAVDDSPGFVATEVTEVARPD